MAKIYQNSIFIGVDDYYKPSINLPGDRQKKMT
jgi:hypothetical protein